ncbi:MAG TPA: cobalamin-independent methionine synthase II family protein [Chloroflexota bacterium]|nr:cobalamin-independent methionine synthase II family protein [Chloroflexota bacterium]
MKRSIDKILTTHTGSLPRPDDLVDLLYAAETNPATDNSALSVRVTSAVAENVKQQIGAGIDIVNDGEMSKVSYSTYVNARLTGFEGHVHVPRRPRPDAAAFPRYAEWNARNEQAAAQRINRFACMGPVTYVGHAQLQTDIENLQTALADAPGIEAFMTAASPGVISQFQPNQYYPSDADYIQALAEAMREEYEAIVRAGFILQLDCPDLTGLSRAAVPGQRPVDLALRVEALNYAVQNIASDRMRLHLCWGNYEGPHHLDVPLKDILGEVFKARPMGLSFEGANPRHEHEFAVFEDIKLPDGKVIIPGVLDTTTNYIEHPQLVAQRLVRYANLVGRENLIAGADCGFGTFAGTPMVHPDIVYAKLASMVEGAQLASRQLWGAAAAIAR